MKKLIIPVSLITLLALVGIIGILSQEQQGQAKFLDWGTPPEVDTRGPWPYAAPEGIQDFVNRLDAIVVATISSISEPVEEGPYRIAGTPPPPTQPGFPTPSITVTYYSLDLEQVLLDDGNISSHPRLRQSGIHYDGAPQLGNRYLFGVRVNPDGKSYGAPREWNIIPLDGGAIHNIDGTSPGYTGVSDETSLKESIARALPGRVRLQPEQWPLVQADENAPAETPAAPGSPGADDAGPTGNTNN